MEQNNYTLVNPLSCIVVGDNVRIGWPVEPGKIPLEMTGQAVFMDPSSGRLDLKCDQVITQVNACDLAFITKR